MDLLEKSLMVSALFDELYADTQEYALKSQLSCFNGCGHCCANPLVTASVLEFLPLAFELYQTGQVEEILSLLESSDEKSFCILFKKLNVDPDAGLCMNYKNRGLICRLFGSSARRNKLGEKELLICKKIKLGKKEQFELTSLSINNGMHVPIASDFYTRLFLIDQDKAYDQLPINLAIKNAIDEVLRYYYYIGEG